MSGYAEMHVSNGVRLRVVAGSEGICAIEFDPPPENSGPNRGDPLLELAVAELGEYFAGVRRQFSFPLEVRGTEFQCRVWDVLTRIPYGETRSYGWVAECLGQPRAVRAVGAANGRNPLPIVVPCHRVIGSTGQLTGYGGGLPMNR